MGQKRQGIEKKHKWERMAERHHHRGAGIRKKISGGKKIKMDISGDPGMP
jgi:hypothetical protein